MPLGYDVLPGWFPDLFFMFTMEWFWFLTECVTVFFIVCGGPAAYVEQFAKLRSGKGGGFATQVSLLLIVCNLLRVLFWFAPCDEAAHHHAKLGAGGVPLVVRHGRYEMPLLFQSLGMMTSHLLMMWAWCNSVGRKATPKHILSPALLRSPRRFFAEFWTWTTFNSYLIALGAIAVLAVGPTLLLNGNVFFFEVLGFVSLGLEATMALPQLLKNIRQRSTLGMSRWMVFNWAVGDTAKTVMFMLRGEILFISRKVPLPTHSLTHSLPHPLPQGRRPLGRNHRLLPPQGLLRRRRPQGGQQGRAAPGHRPRRLRGPGEPPAHQAADRCRRRLRPGWRVRGGEVETAFTLQPCVYTLCCLC